MAKRVVLTEQDATVIRDLTMRERTRPRSVRPRWDPDAEVSDNGKFYVAQVVDAELPGLVVEDGVPVVGAGVCDVYQLLNEVRDGVLSHYLDLLYTDETVYNVSTQSVPADTFILISLERTGNWVAFGAAPAGSIIYDDVDISYTDTTITYHTGVSTHYAADTTYTLAGGVTVTYLGVSHVVSFLSYAALTLTYTATSVSIYASDSVVTYASGSTVTYSGGSTLVLAGTTVNLTLDQTWTLTSGVTLTYAGSNTLTVYNTALEVCDWWAWCGTAATFTGGGTTHNLPAAGKPALTFATSAGNSTLTGLVPNTAPGGGAVSQVVTLVNTGSGTLLLTHEDGGSTTTNRFNLPFGVSLLTIPGESLTLLYNLILNRWVPVVSLAQTLTGANHLTSIVTAAGTTTLTASSLVVQVFTGTNTQTLKLPVVSTLAVGWTYTAKNRSANTLTVQSSGGSTIVTVPANTDVTLTCLSTSGTGAGSWDYSFSSTLAYPYTDEQAQDAVGGILADTDTIDATYNDPSPSISFDVKKQMSVTSDSSGLKLSGDSSSPGNSKLYGTDGGGTKGWYDQPSGGGSITSGTSTSGSYTATGSFADSGPSVSLSAGTYLLTAQCTFLFQGPGTDGDYMAAQIYNSTDATAVGQQARGAVAKAADTFQQQTTVTVCTLLTIASGTKTITLQAKYSSLMGSPTSKQVDLQELAYLKLA